MAHPWDTPPNGDFAAYVERLAAQAAQRSLMAAQRAARQASQALPDDHFGRPESESSAFGAVNDPGAIDQARALSSPPGLQLPGEHPLARGLRQLMKRLETNLQDIAQKQQQQQQKKQ